jgi:hypothetical protein
MMIALSLTALIAPPLVLSAVLVWLNRRGAGALVAAGATVAVAVAILGFQIASAGMSPIPSWMALQLWSVFVLVPSVLVLAVSRTGVCRRRPWQLLWLGPLTFVGSLMVAILGYNFVSNFQHR